MSEAQGEPKFCIMTGMNGNTSIIFQEDKIHFHATQDVKVEGAQKAPLEPLEQPEKPEKPEKQEEEGMSASDIAHTGLAVLGCIPILGTATSIIDAGLYAVEGQSGMAALSVAACIPGLGEGAAIAKLGAKAKNIAKIGKAAARAVAKGAKAAKAIKAIKNASKVAKFWVSAKVIKGLYKLKAQIKELLKKMLSKQFEWMNEFASLMKSERGSVRLKGLGKAKQLLPGEGKVGTYRDLVKSGTRGDNLTPHHMPSAEYMKSKGVAKNDGVSMNMEQPSPGVGGRHRETRSYGSGSDLTETPREALARDIRDARKIYQKDGLNKEIQQSLKDVIAKNKELYPDLFKKGGR
ncbi:MAG: hypothetical protein LLG02_09915 [Pelosinus sp.]|nr:hypothetical protein [Pelosinus sp.]